VLFRYILLFAVAKIPDFIALNAFTGEIAEGVVLMLSASRPYINKQFRYSIDGAASKTADGPKAVTFDKHPDYLRPFLCA
jgi:hypothetical protein